MEDSRRAHHAAPESTMLVSLAQVPLGSQRVRVALRD